MALETIQVGPTPQAAGVASDKVGGRSYQVPKLAFGAEGEMALVSKDDPMPTEDLGEAYEITTAPSVQLRKGRYIFAIQAGNWNGATVRFMVLNPDKISYSVAQSESGSPASFTANAVCIIEIGKGAVVVLEVIGGPPSSLNASLS